MAGTPSNSMNLNATISGLANWDGVSILSVTPLSQYSTLAAGSNKTVANITPGTIGQVLTSNGPSALPTYQNAAAGGIVTIDGNSGSITGTTVTIESNSAQGTPRFVNSSATSVLDFVDANDNLILGAGSGNGSITGNNNFILSTNSATVLSSANGNIGMGYECYTNLSSGMNNISIGTNASTDITSAADGINIGRQSGNQIATGVEFVNIGLNAGHGNTGADSYNININCAGQAGDTSVLRIGNLTGTGSGKVAQAYIQGITGNTVSNPELVTINSSTGQLGVSASSGAPTTSTSWTPTVVGSSSAGTATYSIQQGNYAQFGCMVLASFSLSWTGGTGTGILEIGGIPVAPASASALRCFGVLAVGSLTLPALTADVYCTADGLDSSTTFFCQVTTSSGGSANINYAASGIVYGSILYFTA